MRRPWRASLSRVPAALSKPSSPQPFSSSPYRSQFGQSPGNRSASRQLPLGRARISPGDCRATCQGPLTRVERRASTREMRQVREPAGVRGSIGNPMAVLTAITADDARVLLEQYGMADFRGLEGIPAGSVNSNFALEAGRGRIFLRIYEEQDR